MPMALSLRYRALVWDRTALSAACCQCSMCLATSWSWRKRSRLGMWGSSCTSMAARTWHMVHKGFFLKPLGFLHQEEETHHAQNEVTHNREVSAHLEMIQSDFAFCILEHSFNMPAAECHVQQRFDRCVRGRVGNKVLDLPVQYVCLLYTSPSPRD